MEVDFHPLKPIEVNYPRPNGWGFLLQSPTLSGHG